MPRIKEALVGAAVAGMVGFAARQGVDPVAAAPRVVQTPKTSEAAGEPPRSVMQADSQCSFREKQLQPGESFTVPPNTLVKGDIFVNDKRIFDENDTTGLVTILHEGATIKTPGGAEAVCVGDADQKVWEQVTGQAVVEVAQNWCNNGPCEWVYVKYGADGDHKWKDKKKDKHGKPPDHPPAKPPEQPPAQPPPETPPQGK